MNNSCKKSAQIKTSLYLASFFLLLCTTPFYAKGQDNFNINVSADVISSIELITLQSIRISKAEAVNNVVTINPTTSGNAGKMVATGTPNSAIRINYIESRQITHSEGKVSLTFHYNVVGNDTDDQGSAESVGQESRSMQFSNEGKFYLWIGGNIDIAKAVPGNYEGEFTLEIEYI